MEEKNIIYLKLGELFCGPGGLACGAAESETKTENSIYKIKHGWANDYDKDSCDTYSKNICPEDPDSVICKDVKELDIESLSQIDGFAYGFPCNDFSIVGEQNGFHGEFGPLYTYGIKVINTFKPAFFAAENVGGLASANEGAAFKKILHDLENAGSGYNLTYHKYKSEEYGIPQTRHRIIIVGFKKSSGLTFKIPAPTHLNNFVSVRSVIENPPINGNAYNNEITKQSAVVTERLRHIKPGQNAWTADLPEELKLNVKSAKLSQIYKRVHPDKPSYTITGSGGGGTHGYHWSENRALTNRERARIQTFPDNFVFQGSKESVRKQIGMAVPPMLSKIIFTSILKTIAGIKYEFIEPEISIPKTNSVKKQIKQYKTNELRLFS
jgi:DNA (cytosine-5)-methyltransferase 1